MVVSYSVRETLKHESELTQLWAHWPGHGRMDSGLPSCITSQSSRRGAEPRRDIPDVPRYPFYLSQQRYEGGRNGLDRGRRGRERGEGRGEEGRRRGKTSNADSGICKY